MKPQLKHEYLLETSKSETYIIKYEEDLNLYKVGCMDPLVKIMNGQYSFVNVDFILNDNDHIIGIVNDMIGNIYYIRIYENKIIKRKIIKYDSDNYEVKFPRILLLNEVLHVFYYIINKENKCKLVHQYLRNDKWVKSYLADITFYILTDFKVYLRKEFIDIFYYNYSDGQYELYINTFINAESRWDNSFRVTETSIEKIFLSVAHDSEDNYHIGFTELNEQGGYRYLKFNIIKRNIILNKLIDKCANCTYPMVLINRNKIFLQWCNDNEFCSIYSDDTGKTWNEINAYKFTDLKQLLLIKLFKNDGTKENVNITELYKLEY